MDLQSHYSVCHSHHACTRSVEFLYLGASVNLWPAAHPLPTSRPQRSTILLSNLCTQWVGGGLQVFFQKFLGNVWESMVSLEKISLSLYIYSACHLTVVQAVSISPRTTCWKKLHPQAASQVLAYLSFFWIFSFLMSSSSVCDITAHSLNRSGGAMDCGCCHVIQLLSKGLNLFSLSLKKIKKQGERRESHAQQRELPNRMKKGFH